VLALVAAGQGVALVPELGAADPPAEVLLTPLPTRRRTRIAYRKGTRRQPAVSACIAAIRASTAEGVGKWLLSQPGTDNLSRSTARPAAAAPGPPRG
jgi:hypothetical protein